MLNLVKIVANILKCECPDHVYFRIGVAETTLNIFNVLGRWSRVKSVDIFSQYIKLYSWMGVADWLIKLRTPLFKL